MLLALTRDVLTNDYLGGCGEMHGMEVVYAQDTDDFSSIHLASLAPDMPMPVRFPKKYWAIIDPSKS